MSQSDLVSCVLRKSHIELSLSQKIFLEVRLVLHFYRELSELFKSRYQDYQKLLKSTQERNMFSVKFMQEMINDILSTQEYSLSGIANHTQIPEDVLMDVATGVNTSPTFDFSRKIFELHATVRRELYDEMMRKVASEYLVTM